MNISSNHLPPPTMYVQEATNVEEMCEEKEIVFPPSNLKLKEAVALAGVAQWIEHRPAN